MKEIIEVLEKYGKGYLIVTPEGEVLAESDFNMNSVDISDGIMRVKLNGWWRVSFDAYTSKKYYWLSHNGIMFYDDKLRYWDKSYIYSNLSEKSFNAFAENMLRRDDVRFFIVRTEESNGHKYGVRPILLPDTDVHVSKVNLLDKNIVEVDGKIYDLRYVSLWSHGEEGVNTRSNDFMVHSIIISTLRISMRVKVRANDAYNMLKKLDEQQLIEFGKVIKLSEYQELRRQICAAL